MCVCWQFRLRESVSEILKLIQIRIGFRLWALGLPQFVNGSLSRATTTTTGTTTLRPTTIR